jgi:hypothetical protein
MENKIWSNQPWVKAWNKSLRKRRIDAQISRINSAFEKAGKSDRVHGDYKNNTIKHNSTLELVTIKSVTMEGGMGWDWKVWYEDWIYIGDKKSIKVE